MKESFSAKKRLKFKKIKNAIIRKFTSGGLKPVYVFKNTTGKTICNDKEIIELKKQNPDFCPELGYLEFVYGNYSFFIVGHILGYYEKKYRTSLPSIIGNAIVQEVTGFKFDWSKVKDWRYCIVSFGEDKLKGFQKIYKKYYFGGCSQEVVTKKLYNFFQNFS